MKYLLFLLGCLLIFSTVNCQPLPGFNVEKVTRMLINTIPAASRIKANNYEEGGYWLLLWNFIYSLFIAWLFLYAGLSAYLKKISGKRKNKNSGNFIYITLYFVMVYLVSFPLNLYQNFIRERQYGLLNQGFVQWLLGDIINALILLIVCVPCFVLLYAVLRKVKENWAALATSLAVLCLVIYFTAYPVFIAPLLTPYKPLTNVKLNEQLLSLAKANGIKLDHVYVYNESGQSNRFNASVSGFAGSATIAINDNFINNCTDQEIKAIVAHEIGHYVLNHMFILTIEFELVFFAGFKLVKWVFNGLQIKYGKRWQISSVDDIGGLPLLAILFTCYFFMVTPVSNTIIRITEIEADNYGLNAAREPDAFINVMLKSAGNHKIEAGFWEEFLFFDHPCRKNRILAAMKWKAENLATQKLINKNQ